MSRPLKTGFNTQPPEGGWVAKGWLQKMREVSTHSRPKAAGFAHVFCNRIKQFQHTAARRRLQCQTATFENVQAVSTHSRPKAAGLAAETPRPPICSFNTQPPEGGCKSVEDLARVYEVSTHSRPKAADHAHQWFCNHFLFQHTAARRRLAYILLFLLVYGLFQHTAARRRLIQTALMQGQSLLFQHTAARRRLSLSQKPCSIRFHKPNLAKLPRKARTRV